MTVIKNSGEKENFSIDKIRASLIATSDEARCPLTESDLNGILKELGKMLDGKDEIHTWHIYVMIVGLLYTFGMLVLVKYYTGYSLNAWRTYKR